MNSRIAQLTTIAVSAALLTVTPAVAAAARPLPDDLARPRPAGVIKGTVPNTDHVKPAQCPLRRIGSQLVRCDTLTGAGATAPTWIPEG
jgi:hypothetical protein